MSKIDLFSKRRPRENSFLFRKKLEHQASIFVCLLQLLAAAFTPSLRLAIPVRNLARSLMLSFIRFQGQRSRWSAIYGEELKLYRDISKVNFWVHRDPRFEHEIYQLISGRIQ